MTTDQSREAFEALRDDIRNHRTISAIVHLDRLEAGWQAARQAEREAVLEEADWTAKTPVPPGNGDYQLGFLHGQNASQEAIRALKSPAMIIVSCAQTPQEGEPHFHLFAKPENYTQPTNNPEDCICGGGKIGATSRTLIANCPCCAGVQTLVEEACPRGEACPNKAYIPMRVTLPPDTVMRLRYIDTVEPIC